MEIEEVIKNARAAQRERIFGSFSNAEDVCKANESNPFDGYEEEFDKAEDDEFEKARSGVYANTAQNRRLGRVGQHYGGKKADVSNPEKRNKVAESKQPEVNVDKIVDEILDNGDLTESFCSYYSGYTDEEDIPEGNMKKLKELEKHYKVKQGEFFDGNRESEKYEKYVEKMEKKGYTVITDPNLGDYMTYLLKKKGGNVQKAEENDIEKSDIMQAISGCDSDIKVSKTGKELKAQADVLLSELNSKLAIKQAEADTALEDCGGAPTRQPDKWYTDGICTNCGYKVYDWNETYFPENQSKIMPSLSAEDLSSRKGNVPENREQAECRRAYNDIVYAICQIMVDIKACEILKGLDDGKEYTLTPRQIFALGF